MRRIRSRQPVQPRAVPIFLHIGVVPSGSQPGQPPAQGRNRKLHWFDTNPRPPFPLDCSGRFFALDTL